MNVIAGYGANLDIRVVVDLVHISGVRVEHVLDKEEFGVAPRKTRKTRGACELLRSKAQDRHNRGDIDRSGEAPLDLIQLTR
jgi:hypothetical protein